MAAKFQDVRMRRHLVRSTLVVACIVATTATAAAHDTWLLPASMRVPVGRAVTLDLTSGMLFPNDDFAIAANRVTRADVRLASRTRPLTRPTSAARSLRYTWTPAEAGVATLGVELRPKTLTLEPDKIEEYFAEINAGPTLRAQWKELGGKRPWVESYAKHATTFVRVGAPTTDTTWATPLGLALEIVPLRDPTQLHAGDTLAVRVLRAGKPMADLEVGAIWQGTDRATFSRTDAAGLAMVKLSQSGKLLLNGTSLRRSTNPAFVWESDFVTLTVAVLPKGSN